MTPIVAFAVTALALTMGEGAFQKPDELVTRFQDVMATPPSDDRTQKLDALLKALEKLVVPPRSPDPRAAEANADVMLDQRLAMHATVLELHRLAGSVPQVIEHATWMISAESRVRPEDRFNGAVTKAGARNSPEPRRLLRTKYADAFVAAYLDLGWALERSGQVSKAIEQLQAGELRLADLPHGRAALRTEIERLKRLRHPTA